MNFIEQIFIILLQIIYQDPYGFVFVSMDFKSENLNGLFIWMESMAKFKNSQKNKS
jgi:hypothetical protein